MSPLVFGYGPPCVVPQRTSYVYEGSADWFASSLEARKYSVAEPLPPDAAVTALTSVEDHAPEPAAFVALTR